MPDVKPSEFLIRAMELIDTPEKWLKGSLCSNFDSRSTLTLLEDATSFCSFGAIEITAEKYAIEGIPSADVSVVRSKVRQYLNASIHNEYAGVGFGSIIGFNDAYNTTHDDVVNMFREAIVRAKLDDE